MYRLESVISQFLFQQVSSSIAMCRQCKSIACCSGHRYGFLSIIFAGIFFYSFNQRLTAIFTKCSWKCSQEVYFQSPPLICLKISSTNFATKVTSRTAFLFSHLKCLPRKIDGCNFQIFEQFCCQKPIRIKPMMREGD